MTTSQDKEYTILHLFSGSGGGGLGSAEARAELAGHTARFRVLGGIDVDPLACQDFEFLVGAPALCADISALQPAELRRFAGEKAPDMVLTSPPCLPEDEVVVTPEGEVPIREIRAGDMVWTHAGRFRPVEAVGTHEYDGDMVAIRLQGITIGRRFTGDHPIWRRRIMHGGRLSDAEFVPARDVVVGDRVAWPLGREVEPITSGFLAAGGTVEMTVRDGVAWIEVEEVVHTTERLPVWNLQVAEDNTFCVPLIATHNCKGFSALLSKAKSETAKYQALNRLVLQGIHLVLSSWDEGPRVVFLENVPRITSRGARLLDKVRQLLAAHGYAVAEGYHDCGEIGGLA